MIRRILVIISMLVTATKETVKQIYDEMEFQRACRLYLSIADTRPITVSK